MLVEDSKKSCSVEGCTRHSRKLGMCEMHYTRVKKHGQPGSIQPIYEIAKPICSVDGCKKSALARGWCGKHWRRWRKYGDPSLGRDAATHPGEVQKFIETASQYAGSDCLEWPFSKSTKGYGQAVVNGRHVVASRLICEIANGQPPSPEYQAAHSCGNGHLGCVNPRHLSWKTPKENSADSLAHGTRIGGENHYAAKLSQSDVRLIRSLIGSAPYSAIANKFGVTASTIWAIASGKVWKGA